MLAILEQIRLIGIALRSRHAAHEDRAAQFGYVDFLARERRGARICSRVRLMVRSSCRPRAGRLFTAEGFEAYRAWTSRRVGEQSRQGVAQLLIHRSVRLMM